MCVRVCVCVCAWVWGCEGETSETPDGWNQITNATDPSRGLSEYPARGVEQGDSRVPPDIATATLLLLLRYLAWGTGIIESPELRIGV